MDWEHSRIPWPKRGAFRARGAKLPRGAKEPGWLGLDSCAALGKELGLQPNERVEIIFLLGQGNDHAHASELVKRYRAAGVQTPLAVVECLWERILTKVQVETPDQALDFMLIRWLLYQTLSCRL